MIHFLIYLFFYILRSFYNLTWYQLYSIGIGVGVISLQIVMIASGHILTLIYVVPSPSPAVVFSAADSGVHSALICSFCLP